MLTVENLVVDYGKIRALKGVSIDVREGELVAVIGSNGAGKTTMLKTISGQLSPTSGAVKFQRSDIVGRAAHEITALGMAHVPEGRKVFTTLSVKDNLTLGAFLRLQRGEKKSVDEDIEKMYSTFPRLKERENQLAGTLSGGEQQMLALARALVSRPKLLLLDEPSMGLAPVIIDDVFRLIESLKKTTGLTMLLVEQLAYRALGVADRGYVIEQGAIRLSGDAKSLLNNEEVKQAYLGASAA